MEALNVILLLFVLLCAVAVSLTKNLLSSVIIFMAQGLGLSVIWILLYSPDLAITEAAVALKKIDVIRKEGDPAHDGEANEQ